VADSLQTFAANVRRIRRELGLTQDKLADAAGMHKTHVSKIELCLCEPGARTVAKLAKGLDVSAGPMFTGIDGR
jgi:transcriptional regulator with XRE-family HTH domain